METVEEKGVDLNKLSPKELDKIVTDGEKLAEEHGENVLDMEIPVDTQGTETPLTPDDPESTPAVETQPEGNTGTVGAETDTGEKSPADSQTTDDSPVETVESLQEKLKTADKRHADLHKLQGEQTQELGQLRQTVNEFEPILKELNNPAFRQHVLNYLQPPGTAQAQPSPEKIPELDPMDPESVKEHMDASVKQQVQEAVGNMQRQNNATQLAQTQKNAVNAYTAKVRANQNKHLAEGKTPEAIAAALKVFTDEFYGGNIYDLALKLHGYENAIKAAEKRGAESVTKKFNDIKNTPIRGVQTGVKNVSEEKSLSEIKSADEFNEHMKKLKPGSKEWEKAMEFGSQMAAMEK
ncbi:MAG TPA: hypothetical protein ENH82_01760 [bacterium]|nr:hypothetical protein [bacterium]